MTPEQKMLVQTSFQQVLPIADTAANLFYTRLFELDPLLRPLFKRDMVQQGRVLMSTLRMCVVSLDRLDELVPQVQKLGQRHVSYGVKAEDYATVGDALLWTLEQGLGPAFTPQVKEAWVTVYTLLAETMQSTTAPDILDQATNVNRSHYPGRII